MCKEFNSGLHGQRKTSLFWLSSMIALSWKLYWSTYSLTRWGWSPPLQCGSSYCFSSCVKLRQTGTSHSLQGYWQSGSCWPQICNNLSPFQCLNAALELRVTRWGPTHCKDSVMPHRELMQQFVSASGNCAWYLHSVPLCEDKSSPSQEAYHPKIRAPVCLAVGQVLICE